MTDPQLRIEIAKRLGLNVVGMAHCWAPDGPPWSVLRDDEPHEGHDYSPVYLVDEDDRTGCNLLGQACGYSVADLRHIPDYPGDPREFMPLLEAIARDPSVCDVEVTSSVDHCKLWHTVRITRWKQHAAIEPTTAPTLGRAVCPAWIAWHDAAGGEGE